MKRKPKPVNQKARDAEMEKMRARVLLGAMFSLYPELRKSIATAIRGLDKAAPIRPKPRKRKAAKR